MATAARAAPERGFIFRGRTPRKVTRPVGRMPRKVTQTRLTAMAPSPMIHFTKMQGAGNDFVVLDGVSDPALARRDDLPGLARAVCDPASGVRGGIRGAGAGADGLLLIDPPGRSAGPPLGRSVRMTMWNADGSPSNMCGNGVRCVAKYAVEHGLVKLGSDRRISIATGAGVVEVTCLFDRSGRVTGATVDMGRPILELARIPVDPSRVEGKGPIHRFAAAGRTLEASFVSMGNPHAVIWVDDVAAVDLASIGPLIERHAAFPQRMNAHFVEVHSPGEVRMRSWERGCGATGACGSGACAVCVAGVRTGRSGRSLLAHLPGGDLELHWQDESAGGRVLMTGPAEVEFEGAWDSARKAVAADAALRR